MYYLDSLKDGKIYSNAKIAGISKDVEDNKHNIAILYNGGKDGSVINFFNSTLFFKNNFYSYYNSRKLISKNKKVRSVVNQREVYNQVKRGVNTRSLKVKPNITDYEGLNLVIDVNRIVDLEASSLTRQKMFPLFNSYVRTINSTIKSLPESYSDVILFIDIDSLGVDPSIVSNINLSQNPISYFLFMLRRKFEFDSDGRNFTIMFGSPSLNQIYKININEENTWETLVADRMKIKTRVELLVRSSISGKVIDDGEDTLSNVDDTTSNDSFSINKPLKRTSLDSLRPKEPRVLGAATSNIKDLQGELIDSTIEEISGDSKEEPKISPKQKKIINNTNDVLDNIRYQLLDPEVKDSDLDELRSILSDIVSDPKYSKSSVETILSDVENDDKVRDAINNTLISSAIGSSNAEKVSQYKKLLDTQDSALAKSNFVDTAVASSEKNIDRLQNDKLKTVNNEVSKNMSSVDFDKSYLKKQFNEDILSVFKAFNDDPEIPVVIKDISIENTSTIQTSKSTIKATLLDDNKVTHNITVDIPTIYDGKYVKINGSKKIITKQLMMLPIIKTKPTEVWVTSNYNKLIIERFGQKTSSELNYLKKILTNIKFKEISDSKKDLNVIYGNSLSINEKYPKTSIIYRDISKDVTSLKVGNTFFQFNQNALIKFINNDKSLSGIEISNTDFPVGYTLDKRVLIVADTKTNKLKTITTENNIEDSQVTLSDLIVRLLTDNLGEGTLSKIASDKVKADDKLTFSRAKINNKKVPIIVLLSYELGLIDVLNRYNIKYTFTRTNEPIRISDKKSKLKFADGYLIYDNSKPRNDLLLSGLNTLNISSYNFEDMNTKDPYIDYFATNFNSRKVIIGIHNTINMFVDPITKEVLKDLGQPTNMYDILLLANSMLEDLHSFNPNDMDIYRVRGAEQVAGLVYKYLADGYTAYKNSKNNRSPVKISIPREAIIKSLMELPTVDENSDLNPTLELDKSNSVTYKGLSGRNSDESYRNEIRSYDKSMNGILSIISPDSNKVKNTSPLL